MVPTAPQPATVPAKPPADTLAAVRHRKDEEIGLGAREIYVYYGEGIGQSKLVADFMLSGV